MRTLGDLRAYVYAMLDLEVEDLAAELIDTWVQEGVVRVSQTIPSLPFYDYRVESAVDAATTVVPVAPLVSVRSVQADGVLIPWTSSDNALRLYTGRTGAPLVYTSDGPESIRLYPAPDGVVQLVVLGSRRPLIPNVGDPAATVPDLPEVLHNVLAAWVLYRAWTWDGDSDAAAVERQEFDRGIAEIVPNLSQMPAGEPLVVGRLAAKVRRPMYGRNW